MTTYSLELNAFSIEFDVHGDLSMDETSSRHYPDAPNFVYAVADIWVSVRGVRHFVISKLDTGNLIETLRTFGKKIRSISAMPTLNGNIKIPRGGWCDWMREYWDRIDRDCSMPDDEENYELLIPFDLISGRDGHFCAYLYDGVPTLEVATRSKSPDALTIAWCTFDPEAITLQIDRLQHSIETEILTQLMLK